MAESKKTTPEKGATNLEPTDETRILTEPELRMKYLAAIGMTVGGRYKSVYHKGNSLLASVELKHIVGLESPDLTALVFQSVAVKDAPFQVVMLNALAAFTLEA